MAREVLNLRQAADHVHMAENDLRHVAQRGELSADEHGGDLWFEHRALDEWAQRNLLAAGEKELNRQHRVMLDEHRKANTADWRVSSLFRADAIELALPGKTKAGVVRDMSDLAARTGLVYDAEGLFKELMDREEIASTAVGEGAAFLHPRYHDPYFFQESFIAYARAVRPVFFGAADGAVTRHFFLLCSTDHEQHLHALARLAVMTHGTEFLSLLDEAADAERVLEILHAAEEGVLP